MWCPLTVASALLPVGEAHFHQQRAEVLLLVQRLHSRSVGPVSPLYAIGSSVLFDHERRRVDRVVTSDRAHAKPPGTA